MAASDGDSILSFESLVLIFVILMVLAWKAWEKFQLKGWGTFRSAVSTSGSSPAGGWPPHEVEEEDEVWSEHELGEELELPVDELHFGLPRCRISVAGLERLPVVLKWPVEQLQAEQLEVARVQIGSFAIWVAQGMRSNRLLYVMKKRGDLARTSCVVVEPPPRRETPEEMDEHPDTYGHD